jgi:hypothetical protein
MNPEHESTRGTNAMAPAGPSRPDRSSGALGALPYDPFPALLSAADPALVLRTRRDLLGERISPEALAALPAVARIAQRQKADGRFRYPGAATAHGRAPEDYDQLQTYAVLLELIGKYALTREQPLIARAAAFLFGRQTAAGDFRGIYGTQYTPNYSAAILALLVEAGFGADARVDRAFGWLLAMRQDDGGWAIPLRTAEAGKRLTPAMALATPLEPDRTRPASHLISGIVLRAFAAHATWRRRPDVIQAGQLLAARFFQSDAYPDRRASAYWTKLAYPFRWTDVLSSLDALSQLGIGCEDRNVADAVSWLIGQQQPNGVWRCGYPNSKDPCADLWVTFAACRVLARHFHLAAW